jgi:hypothetical protein
MIPAWANTRPDLKKLAILAAFKEVAKGLI